MNMPNSQTHTDHFMQAHTMTPCLGVVVVEAILSISAIQEDEDSSI